GRREDGLPPGPPTIPILGNLHIFPTQSPYLQFTAWARKYGGIISLKIGSETIILLSDPRIARELIDQKSVNTSDRPPSHFVDLITHGKNMGLARYSQFWRRCRRLAQTMFTKEACVTYLPIQQAEATQLMYDLLNEPEEFVGHFRRYSSSVLTSILAGMRSPHYTSPSVVDFFDVEEKWISLLEPGSHTPVDLLPIFKLVPERWADWKRICREVRSLQVRVYDRITAVCERRVSQGLRIGCALESVLDKQDQVDEYRGFMRFGGLMEGGADTTSLFLRSFVLMLVAFPEVQRKAREEIDVVIGSYRVPSPEDYDNLPYVRAVVKEVLRFRPIAPVGVPHYTSGDETVGGFLIPKGCTIFINQWAMFHDPDAYDNPDEFIPERFLASEFGTKSGADNGGRRHDLHFGGGRRICVGMNLANNSLMLNAMNLLWGFEFEEAVDPITKRPIPVDVNNYSKGISTAPNPFKCSIRARSEAHATSIRREFLAVQPIFERFEKE
ncbi:cytochrome P450 monooxygenase 34, partial [Heterobasidion irregulare TC 32-1]